MLQSSEDRLDFTTPTINSLSPPVSATTWCLLTLLGLAFHHARRHDKHQNTFLAGGVICATILAIAVAPNKTVVLALQNCLPLGILLSLVTSSIVHKAFPTLLAST